MDQSQGGNPFGRLIEFARPHKTGYIVSVVLAVLGVAFGIVQLGMSIQSHDASQRTQGILCVFGGLLIAFSKEILSAIGVV